MPYKDRTKQNEYQRAFYSRNKEKVLTEVLLRKSTIRKWFLSFKKKLKCEKCSEKHHATLHFHHHKKDKDTEVSTMVANGCGKEKILKEISKCQVLCANCHAKLHWKERARFV